MFWLDRSASKPCNFITHCHESQYTISFVYHWFIQTLLFMKAFKHWMSLCWFLLSILSCLKKRKKIMKRRFWLNEHTLELNKLHTDWISKKITYCFLSRSFSKASKRRPRPSWPKLLTQLENTDKPKNQWSNIPAKLLLSCCFIESHRH